MNGFENAEGMKFCGSGGASRLSKRPGLVLARRPASICALGSSRSTRPSYQRRSTTPSSVKWSSRVGADRLYFGRPRTLLGDGHQHEVCRIQLSKCASRYGPLCSKGLCQNHISPVGQDLRLRQQLVMTPQLQQAIKILQLSLPELEAVVQTAHQCVSLVGAQASRPRRASACGGQVENPICQAELLPAQ
jgi:Sigma-54 factor, Activator interacting domain (AID)